MIKDDNYVHIQGWMINRLKLTGNELIAYALLYGFSQDGTSRFGGSYDYIAEWIGVSRRTAIYIVNRLEEKGLVVKSQYYKDGVACNDFSVVVPDHELEKKTRKKREPDERNPVREPLENREPQNDLERVEKHYIENHAELYRKRKLNTEKPCINYGQTRKLLSKYLESYSVEAINGVLDRAKDDDWIVSRGYLLNIILSRNVFGGILNARKKRKGGGVGYGVDEYVDNGIEF